MQSPVTVTITGGAGQIGYALAFRAAHGDAFGPDTPVRLRLLEVPAAIRAAEGVAMELVDCAFPLLDSVEIFEDTHAAFDGVQAAFLVGARPRTKGMERADLLEANAGIFVPQGQALNDGASSDIRVLVVGNPANTNAAIVASHAPDIPAERITAMTRLDHNRALALLGEKIGAPASDISGVTIWGNHSATQYPDLFHARVQGREITHILEDEQWLAQTFIPAVADRGMAVIEARGSSSAASAANAALAHMNDWVNGVRHDEWTSVALPSDGSYGVPDGLVSSFPVRSVDGAWQIVQGLEITQFSRDRIDASVREIAAERDVVSSLGFFAQ